VVEGKKPEEGKSGLTKQARQKARGNRKARGKAGRKKGPPQSAENLRLAITPTPDQKGDRGWWVGVYYLFHKYRGIRDPTVGENIRIGTI